jgi:predicted RNA-binding Zn ribbon-like protein
VRGEPVAVELMNTVWADREGIHDALATTRGAASWWDEVSGRLPDVRSLRGTTRTALTSPEAAELRALRDAIRVVAAAVTRDPRTVPDAHGRDLVTVDDAISAINTAAGSLPTLLLRRADGDVTAARRAANPPGARIAGFAVDAVPLLAGDDERGALRACLAPGCVLFFVQDHALREWCSPACGNRARVARHYRRAQATKRATSSS